MSRQRRHGLGSYTWNNRIPRYRPVPTIGQRTRDWQAFRRRFLTERVRRDGELRCELCGRVSQTVDVHHVIKRSVAPSLLRDRANLRVLCRRCHRREHSVNAP